MSAKDNPLYELAQAMATNDGYSEAIALRMLAQAGYRNLEEVDDASDWTILSIPGLGVRRLAAVRRLTRPHWQPPSPQALKAIGRFMSAARFALRFWPVEVLLEVIEGSPPAVPVDRPAGKRLALELFCHATHRALYHCSAEELVESLQQVGNVHQSKIRQAGGGNGMQARATRLGPEPVPVANADRSLEKGDLGRDSEHFAFPPDKRRAIVEHYRAARQSGQVTNKESWADQNYGISSRTLLRYEREYEQAEIRT